jgi:ADP-heptose:LPS heptosyltransferase
LAYVSSEKPPHPLATCPKELLAEEEEEEEEEEPEAGICIRCCSSATLSAQLTAARLRNLARHLKTQGLVRRALFWIRECQLILCVN